MVRHPNRPPFPVTPANIKIELLKTYQTEPALEAARNNSRQWLHVRLDIGWPVGVVPRRFGTMKAVKNHRPAGYFYIFDGNDGNWGVLVYDLKGHDGLRRLGQFVEAMGGTLVNEGNVGELCCSENKWLISRYSSRFVVKLA